MVSRYMDDRTLLRVDTLLKHIDQIFDRVIEKCGFKFTHQEHLEHQLSFKPNPAIVNCYELVNNKHDLHNR